MPKRRKNSRRTVTRPRKRPVVVPLHDRVPKVVWKGLGMLASAWEAGVRTVTGALTRMFDPRWVASASAAGVGFTAVGQEFWAAVSAALVIGSAVTVSVAEALIQKDDVIAGDHSEIAFVHQIQEKGKR
jgi:hypothetical protein